MSRAMRVLGVLLPFVAAVASCGGGYTAGDACSTVGTAECNRLAQCDLLDPSISVSSCKNMLQQQCCGSQCGQTADNKEEEDLVKGLVNDCAAALKTASCDSLYAGEVPYECEFVGAPVIRQSVLPEAQPSADALKKAEVRQAAALKARQLMTRTFGLTFPQ
jgi:hypothetical protein